MATPTRSQEPNSTRPPNSETASSVQIITEVSGTIRTIVRSLVPISISFFLAYYGIYKTAEILAGKQTDTNILISILGSMKVACAASATAGLVGIQYGRQQKKLRERTIRRLAPLADAYEKSVDPGRGSSGLTSDGRTPDNADEQEEDK